MDYIKLLALQLELQIYLTNRPSLIETCNVVDGISDHKAVVVKSNLIVKLAPPPT